MSEILQRQFLESLREFRPELTEFIQAMRRGHLNPPLRNLAYLRARTLAETAGIYGCDAVAGAARPLEEAMRTGAGEEIIVRCTQALIDCCQMALTFKGAVPAFANPPPPAATNNADKPSLLVADDDRMILNTMDHFFAGETRLLVASNGGDAYALIEKHIPDLVILDDIMPGISGLKLMEMLRLEPALAGTRIIMVTGSNRPQDIERANKAGALAYIIKPFDLQETVSTIRRHLYNKTT